MTNEVLIQFRLRKTDKQAMALYAAIVFFTAL